VKDETGRTYTIQYELFMMGLCVFALGSVGVTTVFRLDESSRTILDWADTIVCLLFFVDFVATFYLAKDRKRYFLTWGWIDLLSSIPVFGSARIGRVARVWRIVRVLRGARATKLIATFILERRAQGAFLAAALLSLLLVVFASIAILQFERGPEANIRGPGDALWWAVTTITTVGYGDRFPVTPGGRVIGAVVMAIGLGLAGTLSGLIAAWFLAPASTRNEGELLLLHAEIAALRREIQGLSSDRLKGRLES